MRAMEIPYEEFLREKVAIAKQRGTVIEPGAVHPSLFPHQRDIVRWMVAGGRRACFAAFGLGKTRIQLETVRLTLEHAGGRGLIVCPLGVRAEFVHEAATLGIPVRFIRRIEEANNSMLPGEPQPSIFLTNYETVRDGKLCPRDFTVISLDEASILRGFGGTKTFRELMRTFAGDPARLPGSSARAEARWQTGTAGVAYRFVATATPSPNEYIELLSYAAYLGIMEVSEAKTRFFKRDSTKADHLRINPGKEAEFWEWVSSWALFVQRPSDLGYSDEGYALPPLDVRWHEVPTDHAHAGVESNGQVRMFADATIGVQDSAREKRLSLETRIAKLLELRAQDPRAHRLLWHDLEAERHAIEDAVPGVVSIFGNQELEEREQSVLDFSEGRIRELAAKPVLAGSGCNFQKHCRWAIFLGIGFKFNDFIQAVHRIHRFLQTGQVRIDLIYTEAEHGIRKTLERKWQQHERMVKHMSELIREHGLAHRGFSEALKRSLGVDRVEVTGRDFRLINGDSIEETRHFADSSVDLIVTSIPFGTQYEYSPSYRDLGHTDNDDHFFKHLGYLTPELLRVLKPGRVAAIHVKDRIVPGGVSGYGFQTVAPFSDATVRHFQRHGFAFLARKTIVTDVVRENNQTYRLGWTEQCKDGSRMGCGLPEYVLLFRKPPSDSSDGYADQPVRKSKERYTRSRWQIDAHGFARSNGDRPMTPEELLDLPHATIFKLFRKYTLEQVYDFEYHVKLGEALEEKGRLPVTFMLLQPASWHPDVWTDIARMRTLNMLQERKGRDMHLCPLQFDIVNRLIEQFSQPGEVVFDPFGGLMTVPYCAIKQGRKAIGIELASMYWQDGVTYCEMATREMATPSLFDTLPDDEEVLLAEVS